MAANLAIYWGFPKGGQIGVFYVAIPIVLVGINMIDVRIFGWIETVGGMLKVILVLGITFALYHMANKRRSLIDCGQNRG